VMFVHRVALGSTVVVAFASNLIQTVVDDVGSEAHDTSTLPLAQCPSTVFPFHDTTFQHDATDKSRRAQATFHFDPPYDGCYLVEEMHPPLMCEGSANTKVHVNYCKDLQAAGTVNQAVNGGQWAFLAALQFYVGHPGTVTLSNEGTKPGTLTVFDKVRFTWSGKSCMEVDAHPRRAEIRMTVDFQNVAWQRPEFGSALTTKLASLANVPEKSLRLIGLRSGSIIAEFLVLPNVADDIDIPSHSAQRNMEYLRDAVAKNAHELCTLTGDHSEGCNVELKDLGFAKPSIEPLEPVPEQRTQQTETQDDDQDTVLDTTSVVIIVICAVAAAMLLLFALYIVRSHKKKNVSLNSSAEIKQPYEIKVAAAMEAGEPVKAKDSVEEDDNNSTLCPSNDDRQSDMQSDVQSNHSFCVAPCNGRGAGKERAVA